MSMLKVSEMFSVGPVLEPQFLQFHGTCTSVSVHTAGYQGFGTRFSGVYLHFSHFGTGPVLFHYHFGFKSSGT